jgi:hypothetical protein
LIGGSTRRQCRQQAVLEWRHLEGTAGFLEQRDMDLV